MVRIPQDHSVLGGGNWSMAWVDGGGASVLAIGCGLLCGVFHEGRCLDIEIDWVYVASELGHRALILSVRYWRLSIETGLGRVVSVF